MEEPFQLRNDPPARKRLKIENSDANRQRVLFSGGDCLPGQTELFCPNGPKEHHANQSRNH